MNIFGSRIMSASPFLEIKKKNLDLEREQVKLKSVKSHVKIYIIIQNHE
jgi:hypothetical protein